MIFGDLKNRKKTVTIEVDLEALIDEFKERRVKLENLHYLLFDEEIALRLLKCNYEVWHSLPEKFKAKKEFVLEYLKGNPMYTISKFAKLSPRLLSDKEIVSNILKTTFPGYVGDILRIDKDLLLSTEFVLENIQYHRSLYDLDDSYVALHGHGGSTYKKFRGKVDNSNIRANFEITLKAVTLYGYDVYQFASKELKADTRIVHALIAKEPMAYFKLTDSQKKNPENIKKLLEIEPEFYLKLDEDQQNCFEYAILAVKGNADLFKNVSHKLRENAEFITKAFSCMESIEDKRQNLVHIRDMKILEKYIKEYGN